MQIKLLNGRWVDATIIVDNTTGLPVSSTPSRESIVVTIPSGASVSNVINLTGTAILGFFSPTSWTTAQLNLEVSQDNISWAAIVYDSSNTQTGSWPSILVNGAYAVDTISMLPWKYIRFRSGTFSIPVNQTANRVFTVIARPLA